jgi:hypothetical protein
MTQEFKDTFEQREQEPNSEVLRKQRLALYLSQLPYVSDEEQADIEKHLGLSPNMDRSDYVDMTDWVRGVKSLAEMGLSAD